MVQKQVQSNKAGVEQLLPQKNFAERIVLRQQEIPTVARYLHPMDR